MPTLIMEKLGTYLSTIYKADVEIGTISELGKVEEAVEKGELKGFGYGKPYLIEFEIDGKAKSAVLGTMKARGFGHDHFSDRAQSLLLAHSTFDKLPRHVHSVDVGVFTEDDSLKSVGDGVEFFLLTEKIEGIEYYNDLERIKATGKSVGLDKSRTKELSDYLVEIHSLKGDNPELYTRRIRDLVGHGECIMGLLDSYPSGLGFTDEDELREIEKKCIDWRWKIKKKTHRLSQVHGDFHPWNIMFREGTDFTVLDRSRGEWGEPADDVACMSINYLFYSLQVHGRLEGEFQTLFRVFIDNYLEKSEDEEILTVMPPFYVWRSLVVASPIWYPNLDFDVRKKLFNFIHNMLDVEEFAPKDVNSYLKH